MRVLVVGAGVIGRVYGAQLAAENHSVSVLDHGSTTKDVAAQGFVVRDVTTGLGSREEVFPVGVAPDCTGTFELVLVCVWADQIESVFGSLRNLSGSPALLFFGNNPRGHEALPRNLPGSVHLGFPGIAGSIKDGAVEFARVSQQATTLEVSGGPVIDEFETALVRRGFATSRTAEIDGWLAYHSVFIASVAAALARCHGDATELLPRPHHARADVPLHRGGLRCLEAPGCTGSASEPSDLASPAASPGCHPVLGTHDGLPNGRTMLRSPRSACRARDAIPRCRCPPPHRAGPPRRSPPRVAGLEVDHRSRVERRGAQLSGHCRLVR